MKEKHINKYNRQCIRYFKKNNSSLIVCGVVVLFCALAFAIYDFLLMPTINLKGSRYVEVGYKSTYVEKGYNAKFLGKDVSGNVVVNGKVDTSKLGVYEITYKVKEGYFSKSVTRKVKVVDKVAPVIKLVSKDDIYVCPNSTYKEEEYSAIDDYDGDITSLVKVIQDKDKITYSVKDKQGNKSSISRRIIYKDKTNPSIELVGSDVSYLYVGDNYNELGYKASDNCDGDITSKVKVSNNINTKKVGDYSVTYTVSDKANNTYKVVRKVIVSKRDSKGTIYLTFDDGPKYGTTDAILDILKEEGIKATFFVTGYGPDELIKREYDEGHSIPIIITISSI